MCLSTALTAFPNLIDLGGTVYYELSGADGTVDPYTLVVPRHLPAVKLLDLTAMTGAVGAALDCLTSPALDAELARLERLLTERLSLTQRLMETLHTQASLTATSL